MTTAIDPRIACRDFFLDAVEAELVGPGGPEEVLYESPQQRYVLGQIAPIVDFAKDGDVESVERIEQADVASGDDSGGGDADETATISRARSQSLSSIGLSFVVMPGASLNVSASWGQYRRDGLSEPIFRRSEHRANLSITLDGSVDLTTHECGRANIQWVARKAGDFLIASVFLVNATGSSDRDGSERLYQVQLCLKGREGRPFLSRDLVMSQPYSHNADDLLYRFRKEYATGLHVAVEAFDIDTDASRCGELRSRVMPRVETYVTVSNDDAGDIYDMRYLSGAGSPHDIVPALREAFKGYGAWATSIEERISDLSPDQRPSAKAQHEAIKLRLARIEAGISLLERNPAAFTAFRFANEAMARTRFRQENKRDLVDEPWTTALSGRWRPFQLAFLLGLLPEMVDPNCEARDLVDVLFFPTGGGKTEAYLGVAAFAMAWRRIIGTIPHYGAGVSVLMRYTLRLLTTQQFSRATSLIASCELMRRSNWGNGVLGSAPFSIGLWVGPMTPTRYEDALEALEDLRNSHNRCGRNCDLSRRERLVDVAKAKRVTTANVSILTECPWCFEPLCIESVIEDRSRKQIHTCCPNAECPFSIEGLVHRLPIWFVDADVYRECPSLLIATVDKFATLPYRGEAKSLFGNVQGYCLECGFFTDVLPHSRKCKCVNVDVGKGVGFDLIIQDELHTINDNIGSVYGLYEAIIEYLSSQNGVPPKYVCATATVKDVARQIRQLYGQRKATVFPPAGLEAGDTFFSKDVPATYDRPGRTYVGIYAPTKSRLTTFVSVLSALLACAWGAKDKFGPAAMDPYLTLLGYFNTIRELGSVKALLADDVPPVLKKIAQEHGWTERILHSWEDELTGRIDASDVPARLALLGKKFGGSDVPCDFMACTNMISVGVDIPRLGLMVVDGQPKTTSEYIQCTSRVGRSDPGIVFVVYNSMRPRDVSHYEHFTAYHLSYYRFVEAGSVTPFSDGCVAKYLAGAFVAGYRLSDDESADGDADRFKTDESGKADAVVKCFVNRAADFGSNERQAVVAATDQIATRWTMFPDDLRYAAPSPPPWLKAIKPKSDKKAVIRPPETKSDDNESALFVAPRSMRNVEAEVPLKVGGYGK